MSRVGKRPIKFSSGVNVVIDNRNIEISSGDKKIHFYLPEDLKVDVTENSIELSRKFDDKEARSMHGLYARLISNAVKGVSNGISKKLDFKGTGYRAKVESGKLILSMGYSHEIELMIPEGLNVNVAKNSIIIEGYDAQKVGNFSATVREVRKPEVYKGKGIKYEKEIIKRKDGKAAQSGKA